MGDFVATSGADRALRVWQRTEEPFFVEEEKEKRLESLFEADLEVGAVFGFLVGALYGCNSSDNLTTALLASFEGVCCPEKTRGNLSKSVPSLPASLTCLPCTDLWSPHSRTCLVEVTLYLSATVALQCVQDNAVPLRREGEAVEATAAPAGRKTLEAVSGAERIADALALVAAEAERAQVRGYSKTLPSVYIPLCLARTL